LRLPFLPPLFVVVCERLFFPVFSRYLRRTRIHSRIPVQIFLLHDRHSSGASTNFSLPSPRRAGSSLHKSKVMCPNPFFRFRTGSGNVAPVFAFLPSFCDRCLLIRLTARLGLLFYRFRASSFCFIDGSMLEPSASFPRP